jgi:hypothetical protein
MDLKDIWCEDVHWSLVTKNPAIFFYKNIGFNKWHGISSLSQRLLVSKRRNLFYGLSYQGAKIPGS